MSTAAAETNGATKPSQELIRFQEIVQNVLVSRSQLMSTLFDPRRNIERECGYPEVDEVITLQKYQFMYERNPIAARVVEVYPKECWQSIPEVYEDLDPLTTTPFEQSWADLGRQLLRGSLFKKDTGSLLWEILQRADILSGIGRYGVILIGLNDNKDLSEPATFSETNEITFMRPFPEMFAKIDSFEEQDRSPRYGLPTQYSLTFTDPREFQVGANLRASEKTVHWTRILHVCDNLFSEVYALPRMMQVLNLLLDLYKLYGGSGEMYWRGAFPGIVFKTHPSLGGDVLMNEDDMKDKAEQYMNGLQRYLILMGMDAESLSPQVVDPSPQIERCIDGICIRGGYPKRIFMGSEIGKLASESDDAAWNDRVNERRINYLTPRLIVPLVDRLINLGVLKKPKEYGVSWPELISKVDAQRAAISMIRSQALAQYVKANGMSVVTPLDFLINFLGMNEKEAAQMWDRTQKYQPIKQAQDLELMTKQAEIQAKFGLKVASPTKTGSKGASGQNRDLPATTQDKQLGVTAG